MDITKEDVKKVARLARLKLTEAELEKYSDEIGAIFSWIDQLEELDTTGIEPLTSVDDSSLTTRADVVREVNIQEQVLKNAPNAKYGYFTVPKVVE